MLTLSILYICKYEIGNFGMILLVQLAFAQNIYTICCHGNKDELGKGLILPKQRRKILLNPVGQKLIAYHLYVVQKALSVDRP